MNPFELARLYAFVDAAYLRGRDPETVAQQLLDGGVDVIQFRAKGWPEQEVERVSRLLLERTARAGVPLVINDYPGIATRVGAPACHLGQEDFFDPGCCHRSEVRALGPGVALGLSTHAPSQAARALAAGADYLAIGPVYATPTKPSAAPVNLDYVRWAAAHLSIPWFAIGGLHPRNLDAVLEAGARRVCMVSALLNAPNPVETCQHIKNRILSRYP